MIVVKTIDAKSSSLKLIAASQQSLAALFSLLQVPIADQVAYTAQDVIWKGEGFRLA